MKGDGLFMKKYIVALLLLLCMIPGTYAFANDTLESSDAVTVDINEIVSNISYAITGYYYSKDVSGSFDTDTLFEVDIASYLTDKVETQQHVSDLYCTNKENYSTQVTLIDYTIDVNLNVAFFEYQVLTTFNYIGCDFDTSVSDVVKVKYDIKNNKIIDMYTPLDYYDEYVRTDLNATNRLSDNIENDNIEFELTSSIVSKQEELHHNIDNRYNAIFSERDSTIPKNVTRASALNNSAIVSWARNNYNKDQPSPGNSSVQYYDFSQINNAYDCTNFVSHAVLAGGAKINDTGGSGISSTGWYFRNVNNRSSSWSGVNQFYAYMTTNTKPNTAYGTTYSYSHNGGMWGLGSIIQFDFDGNKSFDHSTIITKRTSSDGRYYAYVTGRTGDNKYNNNQSADDMSPTYNPRVINVYNR